jgi:hypothetical protein
MSIEITTAMVNMFSANVMHLSQQKGSRLGNLVRNEMQNAEKSFWDRIGLGTAQKKVGRHVDVNYSNTPHSRRACFIEDYYFADLVDKEDKLRTIQSPENEYAIAARNALGRSMDDIIITAALGTAYTGKDGTVAVVLPDSQKLAAHDGATSTGVGLNTLTLRRTKKKFNANEVDEMEDLYICVTSEELDSMLGETEATSADYNSVKALVDGKIDTFMGFKFIKSERLPRLSANVSYNVASGAYNTGGGTITASKSRRCFAWAKSGILFAKAQDIVGKIEPIPTKHYAHQVYASMCFGAVRMEEVRVVEVVTSEP